MYEGKGKEKEKGKGLSLRAYWLITAPDSAALRSAGGGGQWGDYPFSSAEWVFHSSGLAEDEGAG